MSETWVERVKNRNPRLYQQEGTILECTELIYRTMQRQKVSRSELAKRLGKTKSWVTQFLDGQHNMTLRTISDVFTALGYELKMQAKKLEPSR